MHLQPSPYPHNLARAGFVLALILPASAHAQDCQVAGRVTDVSGASLADVRVTLTSPSLLATRSVVTSATGTYRLEALPAGIYEVRFEHDSYRGSERRDLRIGQAARVTLDAELRTDPPQADDDGGGRGALLVVASRPPANRLRGSAWATVVDHRLQSNNLTPQLAVQGAGFGNPVRRDTEIGVDAGGPLRPGSAWLNVAADRRDTNAGVIGFFTPACTDDDGTHLPWAPHRLECLQADTTRSEHVTARLQFQWNTAHRTTAAWGSSATQKPTRGASAYNRLETTNRQADLGRAQPFEVRHHVILANRLLFDARYSYSDASFILDFHEPGLGAVQGAYDRYTLVQWRSGAQTEHRLPVTQLAFGAKHLAQTAGSGRLETSIGLEVLDKVADRIDRTGGGAIAVFDSRSGRQLPYQARLLRDGETSHWQRHWSVWFQESYARGRVAIDGSLRLDVQDDRARPARIPANPVLPNILPEVRFPGADSQVVYRDVSPRLGLRWDLGAGAKTALRASFSRSRAVGNTTSVPLQPTGQTRLVYWWDDADGDGLVRREELDLARGFAATPSPNYDPDRPWAVRTPATVDPGLRNVAIEELRVGVERQVARRVSLRLNYAAKWIQRVQGTYRVNEDGSPVSSSTYSPVSWRPAACPAGADCPLVTFYERAEPLPAGTLLRNDGRHGRSHGLDLVVHKRQAQGWMLDVALRYGRARWFFPEPTRDYTDPTNVAMWNGTEYSMPGPRWSGTIRGSVRLPWSIEAAGVFDARDGLPYARVVTSPNRQALGAASVLTGRYGSERYPAVRTLDGRLQRKFVVGTIALTPALDVFNVANTGTVLRRNATQNSQAANAVTRILPPRSARVEIRAAW